MITLREPILVSRKLAMRHEPDIGLRCRSTCSKITFFSDEKHEADDNPFPSSMHTVCHFLNVPVYAGKTRACVSTCARGAGTHGDVVDGHTTHHTAHHTTTQQQKQLPATRYPQHTTHNTQQHRKTKKEDRERERGREKRKKTETERDEKTEEKKKDKRREETRQEERRRKTREETR